MKTIVTLVGTGAEKRLVNWPEGWPVPREGDTVTLNPDISAVQSVRTVVWYPEGDEERSDPFVYLVLGPPRPV